MTAKRKKTLTAVGAVAMAAVVGLGGTFAWQSINQTALNEAAAALNPGGRLHDDFDGRNKDVYVENFTAAADGTVIFARVRLDEYMELGVDAGRNQEADDRSVDPVVPGTSISDKDTWITRTPGSASPFAQYWTWDMQGGQTVYMPTFNKNKDSLKADINGSYEGTDAADDLHYDDYQTYTPGQQITADATYDNDNNDVEDDNVRVEEETHTAANTINGTVITMEEWAARWEAYQTAVEGGADPETAAADTQVKGDFWVWDADGWAYWANPIQPSTATGLLLDGIELINPPSDNYYYGINVVGQFVTADDIGYLNGTGFYDEEAGKLPTENAEALIELLTGQDISITRVVVESVTGATTVKKDSSLEFNVNVTRNGAAVEEPEVTWSVAGNSSEGTKFVTPNKGDARLWIDKTETAKALTVTATYTDVAGEAVTGSIEIKVTDPPAEVSLTADSTVYQYGTMELEASVRDGLDNSEIEGATVSWSVTGQTSGKTGVESTGDRTATLTVGKDERSGNRITVTASYYDPNAEQTVTAEKTITVQEAWQAQIQSITPGDADTFVTIDGIKWKVLAKDGDNALIWAAEAVDVGQYDLTSSVWRDSAIRTWLQNWLENETRILKTVAQETQLQTRDSTREIGDGTLQDPNYNDNVMVSSDEWITTTDKVFLLSEADLFGTYNGEAADSRDYTYGSQLTTRYAQRAYTGKDNSAWLRNAYSNSSRQTSSVPDSSVDRWQYMALLSEQGSLRQDGIYGPVDAAYITKEHDILPALWIDFSMD
ncbi:MAG TPA: hypothetical protein H9684_00535 [Firmicutes bacterium]|nr:hypothetical protein [Bacillota bacterium]